MSIVFSREESALLDRIAVTIELERLSPIDRTLIELRFGVRAPTDYTGPLPAGKKPAGEYVGQTYFGHPLSPTSTWERTARVLSRWRQHYHKDVTTLPRHACDSKRGATASTLQQDLPTSPSPLRKAA